MENKIIEKDGKRYIHEDDVKDLMVMSMMEIFASSSIDMDKMLKKLNEKTKKMRNKKEEITLYTTPTCHFCEMLKEFLKENKLQYTEYNVAEDIEKRQEMIDKSSQMGVPVIIIGDEMFVGFDKEKISKKLKI